MNEFMYCLKTYQRQSGLTWRQLVAMCQYSYRVRPHIMPQRATIQRIATCLGLSQAEQDMWLISAGYAPTVLLQYGHWPHELQRYFQALLDCRPGEPVCALPPPRPLPSVAAELRRLRRARGWTQQQLAQRAGYSAGAIRSIERTRRRPRRLTLVDLADALQLTDCERGTLYLAATLAPPVICAYGWWPAAVDQAIRRRIAHAVTH